MCAFEFEGVWVLKMFSKSTQAHLEVSLWQQVENLVASGRWQGGGKWVVPNRQDIQLYSGYILGDSGDYLSPFARQ